MGAIDAGGGLLGALAIGKAVGHGAPQVYKRRRKESETQAAEAARASVVYRPKLERVGGWQLLRQQNKMNADRLVEVLRRGIGAAMDKGMAYREFFHKLDADGSGEIEGRELRRTRDQLVRASLVRHAALPGGALLAILVWPKLLPFVVG